MPLIEATVNFKVKGILINFKIIHNLPNTPGLNFQAALTNWQARTKHFNAKSLCRYIMSKDDSFVAMTEKQYKRLSQKPETDDYSIPSPPNQRRYPRKP